MNLTFMLILVLGTVITTVVGFLVRDNLKKLSGSGLILLGGLVLLFAGERLIGVGSQRLAMSAAGVAMLVGAVGLRAYTMLGSTGARRDGHRAALIATGVAVVSTGLYALTLPVATDAMGFTDSSLTRWNGVWSSLFPVLMVAGTMPVLMLDLVLAAHPRQLPMGAMRHTSLAGLSIGLAIALLFPVNYLASAYDTEWDLAYFRTTRPGESTLAIVQTSSDPLEGLLFYPAGNETGQQLEGYFKELQDHSSGNFTYRRVDQALDPVLAEELKVRNNGVVVLRQGTNSQKLKLNTDVDRAKRDLRKLDAKINKSLTKLLKGSRDIYFLTGHGEASSRERDEPLRKLNLWKREVLEAQNFKVKSFGASEGSTQEVPEEAGVVVVAAPTEPLLPEEVDVLVSWFDEGGSLLILLEAGDEPLTDLLGRLGVEAGTTTLANPQFHLKQSGQKGDRVLLATNKFGSHASVKTLSRNSQQLGLIMPTAVWVAKKEGTNRKVSTLVRSLDGTFEDLDGDREQGTDEPAKPHDLAVAIETGEGETQGRAIVVGDTSLMADDILRYSKGNVLFGSDGIRWLVGDEELAGEVNNEEDVKIQHTRQEDTAWFLLSVVAVPALIMLLGILIVRVRRS